MPLEDELCDIIKKARLGLGQSVEQVTQQTSMSCTDWERLEKGTRVPSVIDVESCAKALSLKTPALTAIALDHWEPAPPPVWVETAVITIYGNIGGYVVKGYMLFDSGTKEAVLIDTAYHAEAMLKTCTTHGVKLVGVCLTHGHSDHADGLDQILKAWSVPVYLGKGDVPLLPWKPPEKQCVMLHDGQKISVGNLTITCLATPGHTPGGFCFRIQLNDHAMCFVGDTLFAGSIGRSNPSSLYPDHLQSVRERVLQLPNETVLLPGHGPATTVREEVVHNPFGT